MICFIVVLKRLESSILLLNATCKQQYIFLFPVSQRILDGGLLQPDEGGSILCDESGRCGRHLGLLLPSKRGRLQPQGKQIGRVIYRDGSTAIRLRRGRVEAKSVCVCPRANQVGDASLSSISVQGNVQAGGKLVAVGDVNGTVSLLEVGYEGHATFFMIDISHLPPPPCPGYISKVLSKVCHIRQETPNAYRPGAGTKEPFVIMHYTLEYHLETKPRQANVGILCFGGMENLRGIV